MFVKFDCPHCTNENRISLSIDNEDIVIEDREKLTSYLYDHLEVEDIFFAEEFINEILRILSKTDVQEINLHTILVDTFGTAASYCQDSEQKIYS